MSVSNPHRCCPICGDPEFTEIGRMDADPEIGQDDDEAIYHCEPNGHEFTSNTPPYDALDAEDDPPGTPLAAAGVTRKPSGMYHEIRSREIVETMTTKTVREIETDPVAGANYYMIMSAARIVATTERRVNLDWDQDGNLVGIELLDILAPPRKRES